MERPWGHGFDGCPFWPLWRGGDGLSKGFLTCVAEQFREVDGLLWGYGLHWVSCAMHVD
jgi:hypothetical protein